VSGCGLVRWRENGARACRPPSSSPRRGAGRPGTEGLTSPVPRGRTHPARRPDARGALVGLSAGRSRRARCGRCSRESRSDRANRSTWRRAVGAITIGRRLWGRGAQRKVRRDVARRSKSCRSKRGGRGRGRGVAPRSAGRGVGGRRAHGVAATFRQAADRPGSHEWGALPRESQRYRALYRLYARMRSCRDGSREREEPRPGRIA